MAVKPPSNFYSFIIAIYPSSEASKPATNQDNRQHAGTDWRLGEITVDWVDFTREKSMDVDMAGAQSLPISEFPSPKIGSSKRRSGAATTSRPAPPGSMPPLTSRTASPNNTSNRNPKKRQHVSLESASLQPLLAHFPGPNPLESSSASGVSSIGRGVVHLFRHAPPTNLIAELEGQAERRGESSKAASVNARSKEGGEWGGERAEGEDGSLIAILAVPAWMRPSDFLEFIGGWAMCLEGVRMIREATTPNRSIVLLKFRDPLQASDFLVIFTGRAFSSLDKRETCHPIRVHHLVLHKVEDPTWSPTAIPAFPPSVYSSRALPDLLTGIPSSSKYELPSCPVCLERLDSSKTGLITLPCAHTFDCDCLRKWGDSRCPVCRVSHLLLSSTNLPASGSAGSSGRKEIMRAVKCVSCDNRDHNWICVVCGVVGCGRYEPGKGHARRHWEESGHVLAMELETQRVWDYQGDNYVHRLIQTKNDGKLVELPSLSSLTTPTPHHLPLDSVIHGNASNSHNTSTSDPADSSAGPSSTDIDKMSTIEHITLEYSYLLSSQLEAMRQHYESKMLDEAARAADIRALEKRAKEAERTREAISSRLAELEAIEQRAKEAERNRQEAEHAKLLAEKKAEKAIALTRGLQSSLSAERAVSDGLATRIKKIQEDLEELKKQKRDKEEEVKGLNDTVADLMGHFEAGLRIQSAGGIDGGEGGSLVVVPKEKEDKKKRKPKS